MRVDTFGVVKEPEFHLPVGDLEARTLRKSIIMSLIGLRDRKCNVGIGKSDEFPEIDGICMCVVRHISRHKKITRKSYYIPESNYMEMH